MDVADRRKLRCLADAEALGVQGKTGLQRTRAGWSGVSVGHYHHFRTVTGLVVLGALQLYSKGQCAHISEDGRKLLYHLREIARTASEEGIAK